MRPAGLRSIAIVAGVLAALSAWMPRPAGAQTPPGRSGQGAPVAEEPAAIAGFRSAAFGMNEADLRKAIAKDFNVKPQDIKAEVHPAEKTRLLSVTVKDLLPDTGQALVIYHLGYKSKTLIQVNVVWGRPVQAEPDPQRLVATANMLRNYFAAQKFRPEGRVVNAPVDGGIIAFRGFDASRRMVLLMLNAQPVRPTAQPSPDEPTGQAQKESPLKTLSLQLSYVLNPEKPDVFAIEKGQF